MSTMPLTASCAVIFNAFKYIQRLPHNTLTTQNLPFTDNSASPSGFCRPNVNVAIVQTQSHRAAQTFTRKESTVHRHRGHRFASFFCVAKWQRQHFGNRTPTATIVANPPTLRSIAWSNSSPSSKRANPFSTRSPATSTSRRSATVLSPSSPSSSSRPSSAW